MQILLDPNNAMYINAAVPDTQQRHYAWAFTQAVDTRFRATLDDLALCRLFDGASGVLLSDRLVATRSRWLLN